MLKYNYYRKPKQSRSRRIQLQKTAEIYEKIPEYEEVEHSISSVCVAQAMKLLNDDTHALADLKVNFLLNVKFHITDNDILIK